MSLRNPMSDRQRTSSVQDLMAEGFGSLTPRATQSATGDSAASLAPGTATHVAFAVWNGSHREVGARKAWANWLPMEVPK